MWGQYLWIAGGSALGGVARHALSLYLGPYVGTAFPWATLLINVLGSFAIGLFASLTVAESAWAVSVEARLFFMVGICGGFTTFSSFSLQTLSLIQNGRLWAAAGYSSASLLLCLVAVAVGHLAAVWLHRGLVV